MSTQDYVAPDGSERLYVNLCPQCQFVHHTEKTWLEKCGVCGYDAESPLTLEKVGNQWAKRGSAEWIRFHAARHNNCFGRQSTPSADLSETGLSFPVISGLSYQP